ncbi:hypothetical protein RB601_007037 [Gaeumannomyces tritici]
MIVEREIKLVTEQHNINKPPQMEGFPMKEWSVEVYLLDPSGKRLPAKCFTKVVYNLHPSFENPTQTFHEPPFRCSNEGWGEFEMTIDLYTTEKGGKQTVVHDLNFAKPTYDVVKTLTFRNPSQALQALLRDSGPLPTDDDRKARKGQDGSKKKKPWDLEKLAGAVTKLNEDDLIHVIQMIHDHKSDDTYVLNNVDAGEFSVDLYTMPDVLTKMLWDFIVCCPPGTFLCLIRRSTCWRLTGPLGNDGPRPPLEVVSIRRQRRRRRRRQEGDVSRCAECVAELSGAKSPQACEGFIGHSCR